MSNKLILNLVFICAMIALPAGIAGAESSPPGIPVILYGNVNIDGNPAPPGTTITAIVVGNAAGATSVLTAGTYGDTPNGRLPVSASSDGANVDFYVNDVKATPSPAFTYNSNDAGKVFKVDLNAPSSTGNNGGGSTENGGNTGDGGNTGGSSTTNSGTSGSSGDSTGDLGKTISDKTSTPTPNQGEILTNAPGTSEAKDTKAATTNELSPPFQFSSILGAFFAVVIGAIIIIWLKKTGKI